MWRIFSETDTNPLAPQRAVGGASQSPHPPEAVHLRLDFVDGLLVVLPVLGAGCHHLGIPAWWPGHWLDSAERGSLGHPQSLLACLLAHTLQVLRTPHPSVLVRPGTHVGLRRPEGHAGAGAGPPKLHRRNATHPGSM